MTQKVKFLEAQLESAQKSGGSGDSGKDADGKFEFKIKQLETLNGKIEEAKKKAENELAEKKKEAQNILKNFGYQQEKD